MWEQSLTDLLQSHFKDPEKAIDYAIQLRAEAVGEFSHPEFQKIVKQVQEEVPVNNISNKTNTNAIREQSTSGILSHSQEGIGKAGGEREGMGQGKQRNEAARPLELPNKEEHEALDRKREKEITKATVRSENMKWVTADEIAGKDIEAGDNLRKENRALVKRFTDLKKLIECL